MKQINLSESKIAGVHIVVHNDTISEVVIEGRVFDDAGNEVSAEHLKVAWGSLSVQSKQTVNKLMRVMSKEYNRIQVNEDTETWEDSK